MFHRLVCQRVFTTWIANICKVFKELETLGRNKFSFQKREWQMPSDLICGINDYDKLMNKNPHKKLKPER